MDVNAITTLIGALGFPIVASCGLFYLLYKQMQTMNELKLVLTKLIDKLDVEDVEVKLEK